MILGNYSLLEHFRGMKPLTTGIKFQKPKAITAQYEILNSLFLSLVILNDEILLFPSTMHPYVVLGLDNIDDFTISEINAIKN